MRDRLPAVAARKCGSETTEIRSRVGNGGGLAGGFFYALAGNDREEFEEALLRFRRGGAGAWSDLDHRPGQSGELFAKLALCVHPAALCQGPLHALVIVGEGHVNRQAQQLLDLLRGDQRALLATVEQNTHAFTQVELLQV